MVIPKITIFSGKKIWLVLVSVLALVLILVLIIILFRPGPKVSYPESANTAQSSLVPVFENETGSPAGSIPSTIFSEPGFLPFGFPTDLIRERGLEFKQSTREDYLTEGYSHLQVVYESGWSYDRNKEYFNDYLKENNWQKLDTSYEQSDHAVIDAVKDGDGLRIAVVKKDNSSVEIHLSFRKNGRNTLEKTE